MSRKLLTSLILIVFISALCFVILNKKPISDADIKRISLAGVTLRVELAITPELRQQGLSGRSSLKEDQGMLFIFPKAGVYSFWMKDMNFPIDIIWIDQNFKVVYIKKDAQPSSYPDSFTPAGSAKYVLEVASGFSEENNLKVGDNVSLSI